MAEIDKKIQEVLLELEKLKMQALHLEQIVESERGTLQREANRLRVEIAKVEQEIRDILYNPEIGLLIKIDRLVQESLERKRVRQHIWALWVAVGSIIVKVIFDLINKPEK